MASVRTHTASTGATRGNSQNSSNKMCEFCAYESACAGDDGAEDDACVAHVRRWMKKHTNRATCEGIMVLTSSKMKPSDQRLRRHTRVSTVML